MAEIGEQDRKRTLNLSGYGESRELLQYLKGREPGNATIIGSLCRNSCARRRKARGEDA